MFPSKQICWVYLKKATKPIPQPNSVTPLSFHSNIQATSKVKYDIEMHLKIYQDYSLYYSNVKD